MQGTIAELDLNQPAIVFWMHNPGEITRFERLEGCCSLGHGYTVSKVVFYRLDNDQRSSHRHGRDQAN
jgi:hypothetical protein